MNPTVAVDSRPLEPFEDVGELISEFHHGVFVRVDSDRLAYGSDAIKSGIKFTEEVRVGDDFEIASRFQKHWHDAVDCSFKRFRPRRQM